MFLPILLEKAQFQQLDILTSNAPPLVDVMHPNMVSRSPDR